MQVLNHDVAGLAKRMDRFIFEMYKSNSSSIAEFTQFDVARLRSYLNAIKAYHSWVVAQPELDLPETNPRTVEIEPWRAVAEVENESINDVIRMMALMRDELVTSASARRSNGMVSFDSDRLLAVVTKVEAFLTEYVEMASPLDLPETAPAKANSGAGNTAVLP